VSAKVSGSGWDWHAWIISYSFLGRPSFEPKSVDNTIALLVLRLTTPNYQGNDKKYAATQKDNTTDKAPDIARFYS